MAVIWIVMFLCLCGANSTRLRFSQPDCESLGISHGQVSPVSEEGYHDKDTVNVTCDAGYELNGKSMYTCSADRGGWDGIQPLCMLEEKKCVNPGLVGGAMSRLSASGDVQELELITNTDVIYADDEVKFQCQPNFRMRLGSEIMEEDHVLKLKCRPDGKWDGVLPKCEPLVTCERPIFLHGSMVRPIRDTDPTVFEGIKGNDRILGGDEVHFQCNYGYMLKVGDETFLNGHKYILHCRNDGSWSREYPECERFTCGPPPVGTGLKTDNKRADATFYHGDQVAYSCVNDLYKLLGPKVLTCRMDLSSWFPHRPTCRRKGCPSVRWPENGNIVRSADSSEMKVFCNDGFTMHGSENRTCLLNGTWTGNLTTCQTERTHCPNPGFPVGGFRSGNNFNVGDSVRFECDTNFILLGEKRQTCLESQQWSAGPVKCLGPDEFSDPVSSVNRWMDIAKAIQMDNINGVDHQVSFLLDSSGSISSAELDAQRNFFGFLAGKLNHAKMNLLAFNSTATMVAEAQSKLGIHNALRTSIFRSGGATEVKKALRIVKKTAATKKSIILILNDAINQGGSVSNAMRNRWPVANNANQPRPDLYVITLGGFVQRVDLIFSVRSPPLDNLFFLMDDHDLFELAEGIRDAPPYPSQPTVRN